MAVFRKINTSFWQDPLVLDLTPEEKYFYLYLMTNTKTNQCGIYEIPRKVMEMETGYNCETIEKLINRFVDYERIMFSKETNEIMLVNWIKYNGSSSPKVLTRVESELKEIKNKDLVAKYIKLSNGLNYKLDSVSILYPYSIHTQSQEEEEEEEEEEEVKEEVEPIVTSPKFNEETIEFQLADMLYQKILLNDDKTKKPNLYKWAEHIDKLIRLDKRSVEDIKSVINYATSDSFWMSNVLSTNKLRQQFPKLILKVKEVSNDAGNRDKLQPSASKAKEYTRFNAEEAGVTSF